MMMNHEEIKAKLFEFYDRALIKEEEREISLHLSQCSQCQAEIKQWKKLKEALFNQEIPPLPVHFVENVMEKIQRNQQAPFPSFRWNWLEWLEIPRWERAFAGLVLGIGILYFLLTFPTQEREDFNALWADFSNGGRTSVLFFEEEPDWDELL